MTINNNPLIDAYNLVENIIRTNVTDINTSRSALPTAREKQWIFPYTPEDTTNFYPRVAILLEDINYDEFGSAQFAEYSTDETGKVSEVNANYAVLDLKIGVFTKKTDQHTITLPGKSTPQVAKGLLINSYLVGAIAKALQANRSTMISMGAVEADVIKIDPSYEDNEMLFAGDISIRIVYLNTWGRVYTVGELIDEINKFYAPAIED
jgi:hypothetical protein